MKKFIASFLSFSVVVSMSNSLVYASHFEPYDFDYANSNVTTTHTDNTSNAVFTINNCNTSKLFKFKFNLNPGESLITARDYFRGNYDTGEAFVVDVSNAIKEIIDKPWAVDSAGKEISTYFNTNGNILTQTVKHSCDDSFPITADPNIWDVTKCVAAISFVLVSVAVPAAKIVQIKRGIEIAGGLSVFARLVVAVILGTKSLANVIAAMGPAVAEAISILLGIGEIQNNCKW